MSDDPKGILAYGYDLGGPEFGWKCTLNKALPPDAIGRNIISIDPEKAEQILLSQIVGFTETWDNRIDKDFHVRNEEAKKKLGLEFVRYCSYDYPGYILASTVHESDDWGANVIKISLDHSAADRLDRALKILGIIPKQTEPEWILASFYG